METSFVFTKDPLKSLELFLVQIQPYPVSVGMLRPNVCLRMKWSLEISSENILVSSHHDALDFMFIFFILQQIMWRKARKGYAYKSTRTYRFQYV